MVRVHQSRRLDSHRPELAGHGNPSLKIIDKGTTTNTPQLRARGVITINHTKRGRVAQAWPKPRGRAKAGYRLYLEAEFGLIAGLVAHPHPIDFATAVNATKNTTLLPRDVLMRAAMGLHYTIEGPDGSVWQSARMVNPNAQQILDLVTDTEGAMLFRSPVGWIEITPGQAGQALRYRSTQKIQWEDMPQGALGASWLYASAILGSTNAISAASKGNRFVPLINTEIKQVSWYYAATSGGHYRAGIYRISGGTIAEIKGTTPEVIAAATADTFTAFTFNDPVPCNANDDHAIVLTRTDATDATNCAPRLATWDVAPIPMQPTFAKATIAKKNPQVGDAVSIAATGFWSTYQWRAT